MKLPFKVKVISLATRSVFPELMVTLPINAVLILTVTTLLMMTVASAGGALATSVQPLHTLAAFQLPLAILVQVAASAPRPDINASANNKNWQPSATHRGK